MKLEISRSSLAEIANRGGSAAQRSGVIPILSNVRLTAYQGALRATSTDLNSESTAFAEAAIAKPGEIAVPADALKQFVDRLPANATVLIELVGNDLVVSAKRQRAKLPTLPANDFPALDFLKGEALARFRLTTAEVATLFARPLPAVEKGGSRYYLDGVFLHVGGDRLDELRGIATDGHVLIQTAIKLPEGAEALPVGSGAKAGVIVPSDAVAAALRLFGREEAVDLTVSRVGIVFAGASSSLSSKLVEGTYPDTDRVIPPPFGSGMPASAVGLINLDRASCVAAVASIEVFNGKDSGNSIEFGRDDEGLAMAAGSAGDGNGFAVADAEFEGDIPTIGASSRYLKTALGAFSSEFVRLSVKDPASAVRIDSDKESTIGIVMPMRAKGILREARG